MVRIISLSDVGEGYNLPNGGDRADGHVYERDPGRNRRAQLKRYMLRRKKRLARIAANYVPPPLPPAVDLSKYKHRSVLKKRSSQ